MAFYHRYRGVQKYAWKFASHIRYRPERPFRMVDGVEFCFFGDHPGFWCGNEAGEEIWSISFHTEHPEDGDEDIPNYKPFIADGDIEQMNRDLTLLLLADFEQVSPEAIDK